MGGESLRASSARLGRFALRRLSGRLIHVLALLVFYARRARRSRVFPVLLIATVVTALRCGGGRGAVVLPPGKARALISPESAWPPAWLRVQGASERIAGAALIYGGDSQGAIEVLEKNGATICRVYTLCRSKGGRLQVPKWMQNESRLLSERCGLDALEFVPTSELRATFSILTFLNDWVGPGVPAPALRLLARNPLSYFFAKKGSGLSLLDKREPLPNHVHRACFAPPGQASAVCRNRAEPMLVRPAVLVNTDGAKHYADADFLSALQVDFEHYHGVYLKVFNGQQKHMCFRSAIVSPTSNANAGQTVAGISSTESDKNEGDLAKDALQWSLAAADSAINNAERLLSSQKESAAAKYGSDAMHIEGGVELYTHNAVSDVKKSGASYGICRVFRVCRKDDRSLVFPMWMSRYESVLRSHCNLPPVSYMPDAEFRAAFNVAETVSTRSRREGQYEIARDGILPDTALDILGNIVLRESEPHFMTDLLSSAGYAIHALYSESVGKDPVFVRSCLYIPESIAGPDAVRNRNCNSSMEDTSQLQPAVLVNERTRQDTQSSKYIHDVLRMLPPDGVGPRAVYPSDLGRAGPYGSSCFRSILVTQEKFPPKTVLQDTAKSVFFGKHSSRYRRSSTTKSPNKKANSCAVRIIVLQPKEHDVDFQLAINSNDSRGPTDLWPVSVANQEQLLTAIRLEAGRSQFVQDIANFSVEVRTAVLEDKNLHDLAKVMQEGDIVVGVHDASLTSIVFAKPGTSLIEVQPFSYYPGPFGGIARSVGLSYDSASAKPDVETFTYCVNKLKRKSWATGTSRQRIEASANDLQRLFRKAAEAYTLNGTEASAKVLALAVGKESESQRRASIPLERVCARAQRLEVDTEEIAVLVMKRAAAHCARTA